MVNWSTVQPYASPNRMKPPLNQAGKSGFPDTIATEDTEDAAGLDAGRDIEQNAGVLIPASQVIDLQKCRHFVPPA